MNQKDLTTKIEVYLDDGRIFEYDVASPSKAREHAHAIITGGYRTCTNPQGDQPGVLEHYPAHRILKVKATGKLVYTTYPDRVKGT